MGGATSSSAHFTAFVSLQNNEQLSPVALANRANSFLQKHNLLEADLKVVGERVNTVNSSSDKFVTCDDEQFRGITPADYKVTFFYWPLHITTS